MGTLGTETVKSQIPHKDRLDEVGDVARAIETFRDSIFETQKLEREKAESPNGKY